MAVLFEHWITLIDATRDADMSTLDFMGRNGWEVVAVTPIPGTDSSFHYHWKRPLSVKRPKVGL